MALPHPATPSRARIIFAVLGVVLLVGAVWAVIDYRQKPPSPPPNRIGAPAK
jgi:hypothetical protein